MTKTYLLIQEKVGIHLPNKNENAPFNLKKWVLNFCVPQSFIFCKLSEKSCNDELHKNYSTRKLLNKASDSEVKERHNAVGQFLPYNYLHTLPFH